METQLLNGHDAAALYCFFIPSNSRTLIWDKADALSLSVTLSSSVSIVLSFSSYPLPSFSSLSLPVYSAAVCSSGRSVIYVVPGERVHISITFLFRGSALFPRAHRSLLLAPLHRPGAAPQTFHSHVLNSLSLSLCEGPQHTVWCTRWNKERRLNIHIHWLTVPQ